MSEVIFRKARPDEMELIVKMQADLFYSEQGIPKDDEASFLERCPVIFAAVQDGKILGAAAGWQEDGRTHWGRFFVVQEARRRGIGSRLAAYTFKTLFEGEITEICMEARDTTVKIVCAMGGRVTGEPVPFYRGNVTPVILKKEDFAKV